MKTDLMRYKTETLERICRSEGIAIYGAGTMGKAVNKCLSEEPYNLVIQCFIVKNRADNPDMIDDIPVLDINNASAYRNSSVLIALNGKFIPEVIKDLTEAGFTDIIPISFDGDEWTTIRGNWFDANHIIPAKVKYLSELSSNKTEINDLNDKFHIYVAHSIFDRQLSEEPVDMPYEIGIQVGSALTDKMIFDVRDSLGNDNISDKNRQYCELTGIYWAWKNDKADYVGFSHYRRKFVLTDEEINAVFSEDVDVVVTEPLVNFITVKGQYGKDHIKEDWDVFIRVINELAPEYSKSAEKVQNSIYYYAYNMFIMKREIFNRYCEFIFPILERCEKLIGNKEDVYQNRYVGFLAERLLSIFLTKNTEYKVAIADKHFIE